MKKVMCAILLLLLATPLMAQTEPIKAYPIGSKGWNVDYFSGSLDLLKISKGDEGSNTNLVARPMLELAGGITWYLLAADGIEKKLSINIPTIAVRVIDENSKTWAVSILGTIGAFNNQIRLGLGWDLTTNDKDQRLFGVFAIGLNALK